jgi:hypothetical protein
LVLETVAAVGFAVLDCKEALAPYGCSGAVASDFSERERVVAASVQQLVVQPLYGLAKRWGVRHDLHEQLRGAGANLVTEPAALKQASLSGVDGCRASLLD